MRRILLIDDDHEDQEIFRMVLEEMDTSIKFFYISNAENALSTLLNPSITSPDFIFLDLNLPLMGGMELLSEIKKQDSIKEIPVIIYSTSSRQSDKDKCLQLGAQSYISKPGTIDELKEMLKEVGL